MQILQHLGRFAVTQIVAQVHLLGLLADYLQLFVALVIVLIHDNESDLLKLRLTCLNYLSIRVVILAVQLFRLYATDLLGVDPSVRLCVVIAWRLAGRDSPSLDRRRLTFEPEHGFRIERALERRPTLLVERCLKSRVFCIRAHI